MTKRAKRGEYGENKDRVNFMLTPTALTNLNQRAEDLGISRSELVERFARGQVDLSPLTTEQAELQGELQAN